MDIQLGSEEIERQTVLKGQDVFTLLPGEKLVVKRGLPGALVDVMDEHVPNNKTWDVLVFVQIKETAV